MGGRRRALRTGEELQWEPRGAVHGADGPCRGRALTQDLRGQVELPDRQAAAAVRGAEASRCALFCLPVSRPRLAAIRPADPYPRLPFAWSKRAVWILLFKKDDLDSDSNSLALLLCQRGPQAVLLPFGSPQLGAPSSHSSLTLPPPPPLGSAARCCRRRVEPFWM